MTPRAFDRPDRATPLGIDRSIDQDDDPNHEPDDRPVPPARDTISCTDAFNKPGPVDSKSAPHL